MIATHLNRTPEKALTAQFVRNVKVPGKYFDGHGLYLLVKPNGSRFWVQRITIRGKRCEIGLGSPLLVSLAEVREQAIENRKLARQGGDPLRAKREAQSTLTFEGAARKVYEIHKPTWRNAKHAAQFLSTLETYAFPRLGKLKVSDVTAADVLAVLTPIWTEKHETARRVRQRIGTVLKWAIAQGWRTDNPAQDIQQALAKVHVAKNHRKSLPYTDLPGCLDDVWRSEAATVTKLALEFLVLTAARSGEVREAVWEEFDLDARVWEIPASRMKAKRSHRVPLSTRSIEILRDASELSDGSGYVFPGTKRGKALSDATLRKLVREKGYDIDIHGFRTSFRTWVQEQTSFPREVGEAALAHKLGDKAEQAYARSDLFEKRREMMDQWADFLAGNADQVAVSGGVS
jgi:integrase